nr:MAG TPA: hypothetical protein [Caudoviricetes sp.]
MEIKLCKLICRALFLYIYWLIFHRQTHNLISSGPP